MKAPWTRHHLPYKFGKDRADPSAVETERYAMPRIEPIPLDELADEPRRIIEEGVADGTYATPVPLQIFAYKTAQILMTNGRGASWGNRASWGEGSSSSSESVAPSWANASPACSPGSMTRSQTRTSPA